MAQKKKKSDPNNRVVAENRKARHDYEFGEVVEAGLLLTGTEVKSLRTGKATIAESYASDENGEIVLINANIPEYDQGNRFNHDPRRPRKLLLHKREIAKMSQAVQRDGMTIVPLKLYFNDKGIAKLAVAVARGKKNYDKRQDAKTRDWQRDKARLLRDKG
ncbi:SsrA-binding protein SmpB [Cohaesibacter haloalkalitolerans]|uniref:SsrA-binding protein SmpB n=1 Tax=Cohaesibacter haloalkalitolerans TaxID=1162980 RepID=UPI000E649F77|nr:SsrA-binding protein SmpB [Cohaesibacter haloalkalitolerans]